MAKLEYLSSVKWSEKVKELMDVHRWDDKALADASGVNYHTLRRAVREDKNIGVESAIRIASALGVSANWLYDDSLGMESIEYLNQPASTGAEMKRQVACIVRLLPDEDPGVEELHILALDALDRWRRTRDSAERSSA